MVDGRPRRRWTWQVEKECMKVGWRREDVFCRSKWSVGVNEIATRLS